MSTYQTIYSEQAVTENDLAETILECTEMECGQECFSSIKSMRCDSNSQIMASWCSSQGNIEDSNERPGVIQRLFRHRIYINGEWRDHHLAAVNWYDIQMESFYAHPITVWKVRKYVSPGAASFIPVQRIARRFASAFGDENGTQSVVVIPLMPRLTFQ